MGWLVDGSGCAVAVVWRDCVLFVAYGWHACVSLFVATHSEWGFLLFNCWANPRGNAIRGRPVDGVEQAHSTRPAAKNTGNFIGPNSGTVAEITLQRTDTTHDLSSESREAIKSK